MARLTRLRWGAAPAPPDNHAARERLIDAATECFMRYGVVKTTVEDVAASANVSRATVYRYFSGREELILGVLMRSGGRFLEELSHLVDDADDLGKGIVDGVLHTMGAIRRDTSLALLFAPEAVGLTTSVAGASDALFALTTQFLHPRFEAAKAEGTLRAGLDLDDAAEWTVRTILSLVTVAGPRERTVEELRAFLETYLVPALVVTPTQRGGERAAG